VLGDGPSRPAFAGRAPSVRFRVPSEVLQGTPAPLGRSCDRASGDAVFPGLSCRTTHAGAAVARDGRGSAPPASHVRGFDPHRGVPPPSLPTPCGAGASIGLPPRGLLLASIGRPSGRLGPPVVPRMDSIASPGSGRMRAASGRRARREFVRSTGPRADESARLPMRRCLHEVLPPRAFSPGVLASRFGRARSPFTFESFDVSTGSCHRVLRIAGVGSPLSGPPARPGFFTVRPSRIRSDRRGGRAHGFASRSCALHAARSAMSPLASGPVEREPGPNPPSLGERLLLNLIVGACCQRTGDPSHSACRIEACPASLTGRLRDLVARTGLASVGSGFARRFPHRGPYAGGTPDAHRAGEGRGNDATTRYPRSSCVESKWWMPPGNPGTHRRSPAIHRFSTGAARTGT
jgi:hypothetical protein